jgi:hypothetical protein
VLPELAEAVGLAEAEAAGDRDPLAAGAVAFPAGVRPDEDWVELEAVAT